ncbi:MAG TPA: MFS transporter, partial [Candidatus Saccharimonadales bacterium]|nr:MFS transporter [Candidatus Saccharimonadales bacterium]
NQETDCETHAAGLAFAWAVCPVLDVANALTTSLENLFEDQLSFSVSQLGNCSSNTPTDGCFKVQKSWALMRDIAASLLVIVMLIMVFSQAASFGPFDAYTVKKLLPRLVAAVILMQISWYLFAWVIDLVNDVARGIADIMYYPFGGPNQMDLWHLLSNAKLSDGLLGAMNWGAIAVFAFLGYAFVFTMLGFAFTAIIALFFAVITLVFRKVLLILLLILSPIAVLAWVLPGTERYWKMWRDNFFKALAMFPIAVAIIAAGRIFCSIVGTQDNTQFLNLIFIMVGYFGPLFILPKTFKWGGQAMQMAGENINKVGNKLGERQKKFWDNRQEGWSTERKRRSQERVSGHKQYKGLSQVWNRPLDKVLSGQWDPTLGPRGSRRRFEAVTGYEAAGRESSGKTAETAKAAAQQLFDNAQDHDEVARMLMRGQPFDYIDKRGKKRHYKPPVGAGAPYMIAAGAAGIAKYGTDGSMRVFQAEIDRMRAAGGDQALLAEQILDDNVEKMKPRMDSMYRGFDRGAYQEYLAAHPGDEQGAIRAGRARSIKSSIESMKENWFDGMEGVEAQSLLAGLSHGIASGDPESEQRMEKLWQDYKKACANPNIHLAPGVHKAFKAYADGNHGSSSNGSIEDINAARTGTDPNAPVMGEGVSRVKGDRTDDNGVVIERVDRRVQVRDKPVLDDIVRDDPRNQAVIASIGAGEFADHFDGDGSPTRPISHEDIVPGGGGGGGGGSGSAPEVVISPGQLVIQHRDVIAPRVLPPVATLDPASVGAQATANREAFKIQLQTNPEVVQTLATSIANGIAAPEHQAVLGEMRTAAENVLRDPRATDQQKAEARSSWNKVASQIQQAYLQKTEAIVAHAVQSGTDPAAARTAAMSAVDTATRRTAAEDVQALQPGGASPLSQL